MEKPLVYICKNNEYNQDQKWKFHLSTRLIKSKPNLKFTVYRIGTFANDTVYISKLYFAMNSFLMNTTLLSD